MSSRTVTDATILNNFCGATVQVGTSASWTAQCAMVTAVHMCVMVGLRGVQDAGLA